MTPQVRAPQTSDILPNSSQNTALTLQSNDDKEVTFTNLEMLILKQKSGYFKSSVSFNPSTKTEKVDFSNEQLTLLKNIIFYPTRIQLPFDPLTASNLAQLDSYFMIDLKEHYVQPLTEYIQRLNYSSLEVTDYKIVKTLLILNLDEIKAASIINRLDTKDYMEFFDQIKTLVREKDLHLARTISKYSLKALFATPALEIDGLTNLDWSNTPATNVQLSQITAPLTRLNLRGSQVVDTAFLSRFPHLQHLDLGSIDCKDLSIQDLAGLRELTHLWLGYGFKAPNPETCPSLPKLEFLEFSSSLNNFEFLSKLAVKTLNLSRDATFTDRFQIFYDKDVEYLPTTIQHLRIYNRSLTKNGIVGLVNRLASLLTLDLSYDVPNPDHADLLKALFQKPLKILYLEKFYEGFNFKTIDLAMSTSLESLSVYSTLTYVHEQESIRLLHLKTPNLKHLKTRFYDQEYFQSLSKNFPHLEHLELFIGGGTKIPNLWSSLLTGFPSLKHLSLSTYYLSNDLGSLTHLPSNTKIQSLVLEKFTFQFSTTLLFYFIGKLPSLRKLVIKPYDTLKDLIGFFAMTSYLDPKNSCRHSLRELDLSGNKITDADLVYIVKCFPKVEHLNLSGTQITDAALKTLSQLPLISLNVERTNVTKRI